jgi:hypothetical protein
MAINVGDAVLKITGDTAGLDKSLDGIKGKMAGFGSIMKGVGVGLLAVGTAAVGTGVASVKKFAETADALDEMATRTGMSTKALQEYKYAADLTGSSLEGFEGAIKKMQMGIMGGSKALQDMGVDMTSLQGMNVQEQFSMLADLIGEIQDPTERAAAAVAIFGKSGTDLIPMMAGGSAGLTKMAEEANKLGVVMGEDQVAQGAKFQEMLDKLDKQFGGLVNQLAVALLPALEPIIPVLSELIAALPIKEFGKLIAELLPPLAELFIKLMKAIPLEVMVKFLTTALTPVLKIFEALMPILIPILDLFGGLMKILTPVLDVLGNILNFIFQILGSGIGAVVSGIGNFFFPKNGSVIDSYANGGIVPGVGPQLAMVHGGERIIPAGGFAGGITVNNYISGSVITERDLVDFTRRGLLQIQDRNYSTGIA